jgi:hypothetical protein
MRIATGRVIDGKVVVEGDALDEGATVAIVALEDDDKFELTEAQESALLEALTQADRGEGVDGDELLDQLDNGR